VEAILKPTCWNFQHWNGYEFGLCFYYKLQWQFWIFFKNIEIWFETSFIRSETNKMVSLERYENFANQLYSLLSHLILMESYP
jgi:hypothetical protein